MKKYAVSFSVICMLIFILSQSIYAQGKRILVVAPHEDDETLTCAGVMRNALLQNDDLKVLSVTDGATAGDQYTIDTRGTELTNALKTIGFTMDNKTDIMNRIFYLGYGDYGILSRAYKNKTNPNDVLNFTKTSYGMQNNDTTRSFTYNGSISVDSFHKSRFGTECQYTRNNILNDFVAVLQEYMPDEIYMPSPYESHPDHCSCGLFTNEAILKIKQTKNYSPAVYEYFIYPKEGNSFPQGSNYWDHTIPMDNSELDMNQTPFLWNNRVSIPVPADMAVSTTEANIKCQAIHQFPCQFSDTYTSYPWVNNHARSDEVFWKKDMSNLAFNATVTSSSQDNTNGLIASNVVDGIILGAPYSTEQDYLYDSGSNTYNFEYFINGQPHVVTDFSELRITHKEEWAAGGNNAGAWVQLNWGTPVTANQIKLYDRPDINNNIISGTLQFSDGTSVAVGKLNTNGAATTVNFPLKTFYWVKFVINSAEGTNVGLSEFEVYNSNNGFYNLTHSSGIGYTFGMSSDEIKRGQTFTANENISLSSIDIMIRKYTGTAQSAVKVELYATNGTAPTGTALAVATVPASSIGTSFSTINVPLVYNNLSAGTKYAIVLSQVTPSNANTYLWSIKESNIKEGMFKWNASSWINESNIGDGWLRVNYKRNNGVVDISHTNNGSVGYTFGDTIDEVKRAQTFTAPDNINMSSIEIMIEKLGGTTQSDVLVELYATDGTRPTGSPLKSTTIPASSVGESHSVINVPLSYNLNSGTKYAIVLSQVTPIDDTICYAWSTAEINSNERLFKYTSGSWVDEGSLGDGWLKVYYQKNSNVIDISNTNATGLTLGLPSDEMKRGQTFTASKNMNISSVEVYIRKNGGTAQSNLKVELYATDGVKPTGSALASATYPASSISSNMSNIKIPFISNTLTAGTKYAIVVSQVTPNSTSNYLWATTETNGSVGMFKWIGSSWIDESSIGDGSLKVNFN